MIFTAKQIAEVLDGDILGDDNIEVSILSKIEEGTTGSLSFIANPKYEKYLYETEASIVIINKTFQPKKEVKPTLIKVEDAYGAFSKLLEFYNEVKNNKKGKEQPHYIAPTAQIGTDEYIGAFAYIGEGAKIGNNVKIYPNVYIGDNVVIGDNCTLFSGVKVYSETIMGNDCKVHSGAIIGSDGFGFAPNEEGLYNAVPQIGNVIIEDNVDIGANATIDRATLGATIIRKGVKLDNLVHVAHNVEIKENTVIAAQTGIAGSTKIGKNCMIGGQVGIVGHITIGDNVKIQAQTGVARNLKDNQVVQGTPAINYSDFNKSYIYFKNLPTLARTLQSVEKKVDTLKNENE